MKTIITIFFVAISSTVFSQKYEQSMKGNIERLYQLTNSGEIQSLGNKFERIAQAEPDKWLPAYYSAYCYVRSTFFDNMESDEKQKQLDKAQNIIDQLMKNEKDESEIYCLQAFVYQMRITGMGDGAKYSKKANDALDTAKKLNPENPRVSYLKGTNTFHTPKFFGGGAEKAKPFFEKAAKLFESYTPQNKLMPTWGEHHNNKMLEKCKE